MPHIVTVKQECVPVHQVKRLFHLVRDGGFSRTRQASEPQNLWFLVLQHGVCVTPDVGRLPMDILCTAQRKVQHSGSNGCVADLVDQDETTECVVFRIWREHNGPVCRNLRNTNRVKLQRFGRHMLHAVHINRIFGRLHSC